MTLYSNTLFDTHSRVLITNLLVVRAQPQFGNCAYFFSCILNIAKIAKMGTHVFDCNRLYIKL